MSIDNLKEEFDSHFVPLFSDNVEAQKNAISRIKETLLKHPSFVENDVIKCLVARYMLSDEVSVRILVEDLFNSLMSQHEADGDKNEVGKRITTCVEERGAYNDFLIGSDQEARLKSIRAVVNGRGVYLVLRGGFGFVTPLRRTVTFEGKLPSFEEVSKAICDANFLGEGLNARVYKVGSQQEYVIKVNKITHGEPPVPTSGKEPIIVDIPALQGRNVGQAIALYGPHVCLQFHQTGETCGLPRELLDSLPHQRAGRTREEIQEHQAALTCPQQAIQIKADFHYEIKRQRIANLPLDGYLSLFKDIRYLNENGMYIDPTNGGNLLFDTKAGQFKIVDVMYGDNNPTINAPVESLNLMIDWDYHSKFYLGKKQPQIREHNREIVYKTLRACEDISLPLTDELPRNRRWLNECLNAAGLMPDTSDRKDVDKRIVALSSHSLPKAIPFSL